MAESNCKSDNTSSPKVTEESESNSSPQTVDDTKKPKINETYDGATFWKKITIGTCTVADNETVLAATKDLCHSILLAEKGTVVMEKAAKLTAQLRYPRSDPLHPLVDYEKVQQFFKVDPNIRLDLSVPDENLVKRYKSNRTDWKGNFISSVDNLCGERAAEFGPSFACLILRLGKQSVESVARKLTVLFTKFNGKFYGLDLNVEMPPEKHLIALLRRYAGAKPRKIFTNTVYGGFMYAYHKQSSCGIIEEPARGLLAFLLLQSMCYSGMALITLVDAVRQICSWNRPLYFKLTMHKAPKSWISFIDVLSTHTNKDKMQEDPFWMYSREFSDHVFREVSYRGNEWLCLISAFLIDSFKNPTKIEEWPVLGPKYRSLTNTRRRRPQRKLSREDVEFAKSVKSQIRREMWKPGTPEAALFLRLVEQNLHRKNKSIDDLQ